MRRRTLIKLAVMTVVLAGLGYLFVRSIRSSQAEPYTVAGNHLRNWQVALPENADALGVMLGLQPPHELPADLFRQIFKRTMASLSAPPVPQIPLVLSDEFDRVLGRVLSPDDIAAAAREAGLERAVLQPRCLALHRTSSAGASLELYFVIFDVPEFVQFRERLAETLRTRGGDRQAFNAAEFAPALIVARSDREIRSSLPFRADADRDCVAPVTAN
jgi:hypothetical protein